MNKPSKTSFNSASGLHEVEDNHISSSQLFDGRSTFITRKLASEPAGNLKGCCDRGILEGKNKKKNCAEVKNENRIRWFDEFVYVRRDRWADGQMCNGF